VAWMCSGCGEIFLEPTIGSTPGEKGTILIDEFVRHVAKVHNKKTVREDLKQIDPSRMYRFAFQIASARPIRLASVIRHKARLRSWGTLTMPLQCLLND